MKKPLLALCLLSASFITNAQTDKGNWMVGGSLGSIAGQIAIGEPSYGGFGLSINPAAGYFVKNNLAVGAGIQLTPWIGDEFSFGYGIQPFVRRYFGKGLTKPFAEASAGYSGFISAEDGRPFFLTANVGSGLAYFITPNVALESRLSVSAHSGSDWEYVALMPAITVGFQLHLQSLKRAKPQAAIEGE
ncbi:hypothetical protein [Polluticoccus soli]|uniref:hypothetical protein n=1 Tax=Polluticoccus soli TaxID=3034150 RepID=UPI0023E1B656|nr:hypothetical protein [Flavipsychrobacter sp. JY13-12]